MSGLVFFMPAWRAERTESTMATSTKKRGPKVGSKHPPKAVEPRALLDRQATAELLDLSTRTVERLEAAGKLGPAPVVLGDRQKYRRGELLDWVAASCPDRETWQGRGNGGGE